MTDDELSATVQNARSLLLTNWGERPMHYTLGCNLREFLFEQLRDETLKQKVADRVIDQFRRWIPFIELTELNIAFASDDSSVGDNEMRVSLRFRFIRKPQLVGELSEVIGS